MNLLKKIFEDLLDEETKLHSYNLATLCQNFQEVLTPDPIFEIHMYKCGLFHDIGKIQYSYKFLNKQERFNDEEYEFIKLHSSIGYNIVSKIDKVSDISLQVKYHHENWDGSGYPEGLKYKNIPYEARILTICDSQEQMKLGRPYQNPKTDVEIVKDLLSYSEKRYDPNSLNVFINNYQHIIRNITY